MVIRACEFHIIQYIIFYLNFAIGFLAVTMQIQSRVQVSPFFTLMYFARDCPFILQLPFYKFLIFLKIIDIKNLRV